MILQGHVSNGVVVLDNGTVLPDGTPVQVTPIKAGEPSGRRQTPANDPFAGEVPGQVSKERREALLSLIGMCKVDNPPDDEEVKRIIDEERMRKYG